MQNPGPNPNPSMEEFLRSLGVDPEQGPKMKSRIGEMGRKALIVLAIAAVIVALLAYWWFHPPINVHDPDTWVFVTIVILIPAFLMLKAFSRAYAVGTKKRLQDPKKARLFDRLAWVPVGVVVVGLIGMLMSFPFFPGNAQKYTEVLQSQEESFVEDIQEVNYSEIPVIDRASASLLGNRTMGAAADYVSQFEISPLYSQVNYQGKPVRVSPLVYADIFKWLGNRAEGIPAYVLVEMATQDTELVRLEEGIRYSQSEPLFRNIDRHVQLKYPTYMFDEKSFEIDDDGHPWWVAPVQKRSIGLFGGRTIQRVVLCDAVTGETQDLELSEVPEWIDRVFPADLLIEQFNWSGAYKKGFINSIFGQDGVVRSTPGTDGMRGYNYIAKDDDVWVYTGVTSANSDSSIVGFILVNQRTQESHYYPMSGATEESAMRSAEGQVQHLGYRATFPLLINVNGRPTYFMSLKDNAGLVKMYAMIDIVHYQNVAVGNTVSECQDAYTRLLATNAQADGVEVPDVVTASVRGEVRTITQGVIEGNSHFYIQLVGDEKIYDCPIVTVMDAVVVSAGDEVTLEYVEGVELNTVTKLERH